MKTAPPQTQHSQFTTATLLSGALVDRCAHPTWTDTAHELTVCVRRAANGVWVRLEGAKAGGQRPHPPPRREVRRSSHLLDAGTRQLVPQVQAVKEARPAGVASRRTIIGTECSCPSACRYQRTGRWQFAPVANRQSSSSTGSLKAPRRGDAAAAGRRPTAHPMQARTSCSAESVDRALPLGTALGRS